MDEPPPVHLASIEWSSLEVASLQLLALCDNSGARRGFYDELLALLHHSHKKSIDLSKARGHESLLSRIGVKVSAPKAKVSVVDGRPIVYFPFKDSLRDLLLSTFDYVENLCVNKSDQDRFKPFEPIKNKDYGEIMAKDWSRESREDIEGFDPENDLFLPIMMYGNKTGTNINQRYPLEPWMFTACILRRLAQEKSNSWRLYHQYMSVLLRDIKVACRDKPVMWVNLGGVWSKRRLYIKLAIISGEHQGREISR
jgi:hypothetical protein